MIYRYIFTALLTVVMTGCASVHSGRYASEVNGRGEEVTSVVKSPLIISAKLNIGMSSEYFGMIEFTFENQSDEWIRLSNIVLHPENEANSEHIKIIGGEELDQWYSSTLAKKAISDHNFAVGAGLLLGAGVAAMAKDNGSGVSSAGAVLAGTSVASMTLKGFNEQLNKLEGPAIFPKTHLFHSDVLIPPKLFTRKWLVLNTKKHDEIENFSSLVLNVKTKKSETKRYIVNFRRGGSHNRKYWKKFSWVY